MKAMLLAAGRGERMRPLTDSVPKPLLPVGGKPLLDYHIEALRAAGIRELVVNTAWQGQQIHEHLGDGQRFGVRVAYSDEGDTPLETGGGVLRALPLLGEQPFWLVNGDVYTEHVFRQSPLPPGVVAHLLLVDNPAHNPHGDFTLFEGRVSNLGDQRLTYSGLAVLSPRLFAGCSDGVFPLAPLLRTAADRGQVTGERLTAYWCDVGTPERLAALDQRLQAGTAD